MKAVFIVLLIFLVLVRGEETMGLNEDEVFDSDDYGDYNLSNFEGEDELVNDTDISLRGRWSYLLPRQEHICVTKCRKNGKPFARFIGAQCQCLCPINALELNLCVAGGGPTNCYPFCRTLGYKGGNCLYNQNCFCFCGYRQPYNPAIVYPMTS